MDAGLTLRIADALQLKSKAREVSPVVSINGVDVDEYLQSMSIAGSSQDWDALYALVQNADLVYPTG